MQSLYQKQEAEQSGNSCKTFFHPDSNAEFIKSRSFIEGWPVEEIKICTWIDKYTLSDNLLYEKLRTPKYNTIIDLHRKLQIDFC